MRNLATLAILAVLCLAQSGARSGIDTSALDPACKPCDDFWRYATGSWNDKHPIPADRASWGAGDELREANQERLRTILETASASPGAGDQRRVGDFYASCMDTASIEAAGAKPIKVRLDRIAAIRSRQDLAGALAEMEGESPVGPTVLGAGSDPDNADQVIAVIRAGGLSLPDRDYYFRDDARSKEIRNEFVTHVERTLELLGDGSESAAAGAKSVLAFETVLANASLTRTARRDPYQTRHKMDLGQLSALEPAYVWKDVFENLKLPASSPVNVTEPEFLKAVNRQLESAPIETWKTWLRWRIVNERSRYLSKPFYDEWFHFNQTVLSGVNQQLPRWKECVTAADVMLGEALGRMYVEKYFPPEAQRRMRELVANLGSALGEELRAADWLAPETRQRALHKLDTFDPRIGFPVKWRDYSNVQVNRGAYGANVASATREEQAFQLAKIGKKLDRSEWTMTPPTVNAYYNSERNAITFPAGILQAPFFQPDADDAANYGAIGMVIGHEMSHGFDDQGSKFDADGNLKSWWTDRDRTQFEARAACVTNQFDSIDVGTELRHNGKLVTGEAMGDLNGIRIAYDAYHRSLGGKEPPVINGFTGDQRFFLAFARVWAGTQRPEDMQRQLATDPHPLRKYRVNATLQNMPEFHRAFACKRGDPMVRPPDQQCRLW